MGQADPILTKLNAGPAVKKLVETALALSSSQDPQQRNHAYSFMESAIKELEDDENKIDEQMGMHSDEDGLTTPTIGEQEDDTKDDKLHENHDDKDEHKIHEEELSNHNQGQRTTGSEQSTDNTPPYPGEGKDTTTGEKPMQDMDDTVNQWSETNGMIVPGLPPVGGPNGMPNGMPNGAPNGMPNGAPNGAPNGMPNGAPGLAPDIAQEMGMGMPPPPPMDTNQMMRQMQYTADSQLRKYHDKVVTPLNNTLNNNLKQQREINQQQRETLNQQKEVIKKLSIELRESVANSGNLKLDLDSMKKNSSAQFREIEPRIQGYTSPAEVQSVTGVQPLPNYQRNKVAIARSEIEQMNKMLNSNKNPMYN